MDFELTDDQVSLQAGIRRFLGDRVTSEMLRACMDLPGAVDRLLWRELGEMGVFSLTLPEAGGGAGLGLADAAIVFEELGRAAVPGPLVATFLAGAARLVEGAATGDTVVGFVRDTTPAMIEHLEALDVLLVAGPDGSRGLGRIDRGELPAGTAVALPLDPLTPVHVADHMPAARSGGDGEVLAVIERDGRLLGAAFQVGLGQAALELGTAYAKERKQFGRAIGSFQAVKHLLADAAVRVEIARAGVHAAGVALDEAVDDADAEAGLRAVDTARIVASRAADVATRACIQVHGGIGFTWELDAHLFLKRALVLDVAFGSVDESIDALAAAR